VRPFDGNDNDDCPPPPPPPPPPPSFPLSPLLLLLVPSLSDTDGPIVELGRDGSFVILEPCPTSASPSRIAMLALMFGVVPPAGVEGDGMGTLLPLLLEWTW